MQKTGNMLCYSKAPSTRMRFHLNKHIFLSVITFRQHRVDHKMRTENGDV